MAKRFPHGQLYDVFLSYSSSNAEWVRRFHDDLKQDLEFISGKRIEIFLDKGRLTPGDRWDEKIPGSVVQSVVFVAILSPGFRDSEYCRRELNEFLRAHGQEVRSAYKGRVTSVELILEATSLPDLQQFQAVRFFKDSGPIRKEYDPSSNDYNLAVRTLATGIMGILESFGEAAPLASGRFEPSAEISFSADCVLDEKSVRASLGLNGSLPAIRFHPAVNAEIERIEGWWANFDSKSKIFPWGADNAASRQKSLAFTRAHLRDNRDRIQRVLSGAPSALGRALDLTAGAPPDLREAALAQLARFIVLQIIRLLQLTDGYLPDEGPAAHTSFPTLPRVPGWLVDLVPERSAVGELVFREDQFLLARVGATERDYETVVVPRFVGQHLHRSNSIGDDNTYYKWVLPQWIHYSFDRPLPLRNNFRIWVLKDALSRECYLSSSPRPWEQ